MHFCTSKKNDAFRGFQSFTPKGSLPTAAKERYVQVS